MFLECPGSVSLIVPRMSRCSKQLHVNIVCDTALTFNFWREKRVSRVGFFSSVSDSTTNQHLLHTYRQCIESRSNMSYAMLYPLRAVQHHRSLRFIPRRHSLLLAANSRCYAWTGYSLYISTFNIIRSLSLSIFEDLLSENVFRLVASEFRWLTPRCSNCVPGTSTISCLLRALPLVVKPPRYMFETKSQPSKILKDNLSVFYQMSRYSASQLPVHWPGLESNYLWKTQPSEMKVRLRPTDMSVFTRN